jgi:hypothetical protein
MTQEVTTISSLFSTPYLTIAEYKQAPTSVDVDDLVGGGSAGINDQELANCIARASSWIDVECNQVLGATLDTEQFRARISRDGMLKIHPRYNPVMGVVSASYGNNPLSLSALDATTAWIDDNMSVVFPMGGNTVAFLGTIQFAPIYSPYADQYVQLTYVNGYANTVNTASSNAGVTSLALKDLTGFVPNQKFMVYDGVNTEVLQVSSSFTVAQGAGSLTLASATAYSHTSGVSVSALPPAIKQAAIYMTNVILKSRGNATITMGGLTPSYIQSENPAVADDYNSAMRLLEPFRRIR